MDQALISSLDLHVILSIFLEQVTTKLGVDAANILLLNSQTQKLECAATHGFQPDTIASLSAHGEKYYASHAMLERRIIYASTLSDIKNSPQFAELVKGEKFIIYYGVPLITKGRVKGVLEIFHRSPLNPDHEWLGFLEAIGALAAVAIDNASLFEGMQRTHEELTLAYDVTIKGWSRALDLRDKETEGHSQHVAEVTVELAQAFGIDGSGYPQGLKGEQIPLAARIFAIIDVCDALSFVRPYGAAWQKDKVVEYIKSQSGILFDSRVVELFLKMKQ